MAKLGIVERDPSSGEDIVKEILPNEQVAELLGADPEGVYTDPALATRMVEIVAERPDLVILGDPDRFSPEVLDLIGPYLTESSEEESNQFYGEAEGPPLAPPVAPAPAMPAMPAPTPAPAPAPVVANPDDLAPAAAAVTARQLEKLLNGGSPQDREAALAMLTERSTGGPRG